MMHSPRRSKCAIAASSPRVPTARVLLMLGF
jgi:hypothetical protein